MIRHLALETEALQTSVPRKRPVHLNLQVFKQRYRTHQVAMKKRDIKSNFMFDYFKFPTITSS